MTTTIILFALFVVLFGIAVWRYIKANRLLTSLRIDSRNEMKWRIAAESEMCEYRVVETSYGAYVYKHCFFYPSQRITVKVFQNDDIEYARLCAQELCDKLNEDI